MKVTKKQAILSLLYDLKEACEWAEYNHNLDFEQALVVIILEIENSIMDDKTIGI